MMAEEGRKKRVRSFVDAYNKLNYKRAVKIFNQENTPIHKVSFDNSKLRKWTHDKRRVGRPRANWTEETIKEIWDIVKKNHTDLKFSTFVEDSERMTQLIKDFEATDENCYPPPPA